MIKLVRKHEWDRLMVRLDKIERRGGIMVPVGGTHIKKHFHPQCYFETKEPNREPLGPVLMAILNHLNLEVVSGRMAPLSVKKKKK